MKISSQVRCSRCCGSGVHPLGGKCQECDGQGVLAFTGHAKRRKVFAYKPWREAHSSATNTIYVVGNGFRGKSGDA